MGLRESEAKIASLEASLASLESEDILQKEAIVKQIEEIRQTAYTHMDAWDSVYLARHPKRPKASDYIARLFDDFMELHGDRFYGDDGACQGEMCIRDRCNTANGCIQCRK